MARETSYKVGDITPQGTIIKATSSDSNSSASHMIYEIECNKCNGTHKRRGTQLKLSTSIKECPMYVHPCRSASYEVGDITPQGVITKDLGRIGKRKNKLYEIRCNDCQGVHERRTDQLSGSWGITDCPMYVSPMRGRGVGNHRDTTLRRVFGITLEEYLKMHDEQDSCCAICNKSAADNGKALAVDHCHTTGKIRGLLCDTCNRGLGYFKDNPDTLVTAIQYLRKYSEDDTSIRYIPIRVK